jgi:hypothetical protein
MLPLPQWCIRHQGLSLDLLEDFLQPEENPFEESHLEVAPEKKPYIAMASTTCSAFAVFQLPFSKMSITMRCIIFLTMS